MKLLCTGDLHLTERSWLGPEWLDRQAAVWREIVELAAEEDVDGLLFAGDAFEHRRPTPREMEAFQRPLHELPCPAVAIVGNHDVESQDRPTALEVAAHGSSMIVARTPRVSYIESSTSITTLPWTPVSHLVAANGGGDRDRIFERAAELLVEAAKGARGLNHSILLAHWSVSGSRLPNGLPVDQLREPIIDGNSLLELGYEAIVLGHIHLHQDFRTAGTLAPSRMFYVGSPMPLNFGEADNSHGVVIYDTADSVSPARFHELRSTQFHKLDLEGEWLDKNFELARPDQYEDGIVRVRIHGSFDHAEAIRRQLLEAGAWKVVVQTVRELTVRRKVAGIDETVGVAEALERWLKAEEPELVEHAMTAAEPYLGGME